MRDGRVCICDELGKPTQNLQEEVGEGSNRMCEGDKQEDFLGCSSYLDCV